MKEFESKIRKGQMLKVIYTIRSSQIGGSEKSLLLLLDHLPVNVQKEVIIPRSGQIEEELRKRNIKYYNLNRTSIFSLKYFYKLYSIYKSSNCQIVHHISRRIDTLPAKILGIKTIERNNISRVRSGWFLNKVVLIDRLTSTVIDRIICASQELKNSLVKRGIKPHKICVIYNGVDFNKFHQISSPSRATVKPLLGIFGRLHPEKGHEVLFSALQHYKKSGSEFILWVIGDGHHDAFLKQLARQLDLKDEICFLGFKEDLNKYYNQCDVIVVPSLHEAFPNVILEAFAVGKTVIASDVGGIPEIVQDGDNGILVPPQDPFGLAKAIAKLIGDEKLRKRLSLNAFNHVSQNFSLEMMIRDTFNLYKELTKS